jgi:hypothetical protein
MEVVVLVILLVLVFLLVHQARDYSMLPSLCTSHLSGHNSSEVVSLQAGTPFSRVQISRQADEPPALNIYLLIQHTVSK